MEAPVSSIVDRRAKCPILKANVFFCLLVLVSGKLHHPFDPEFISEHSKI